MTLLRHRDRRFVSIHTPRELQLLKRVFGLHLAVSGLLGAVGCGTGGVPTADAGNPKLTASMGGQVLGGQQPISGVDIQLYAAGSTGYGSAYSYASGSSLLGNHIVTTDGGGSFNLTGTYTCPSADAEVYLVGRGGSPISGGPNNPNMAMMAALGPCGNLNASTYISMNELTTVASVWALAPFMSSTGTIGTTPSNNVGLRNAFAAVNKLVSTRSGSIPGPALPQGATLPAAEMNSLADILAVCINSNGGVSGDGSPCGILFALTTPAGGSAPTDVISAALNIARNPGRNVTALGYLASSIAPFQPTVSGASLSSWTLAVRYAANGSLSAPASIAGDQQGNIWIKNTGAANLVELDNSGAVLSGASGYAPGQVGSGTIAVDPWGGVWVAASTPGAMLKITPSLTSTFTGGSWDTAAALAIDGEGSIWVDGNNSTISRFDRSGALLSPPSGYPASGASSPQSIAITTY